jgi:hypothetical protein
MILPVLNYGCEVWTTRENETRKLQTTQRAMKTRILGIKMIQKIPNTTVRETTEFEDAYTDAPQRKLR